MPATIAAQYRSGGEFRNTRLRYVAEISHLHGNKHPHISMTGSLMHKVNGVWQEGAFGCIHEDILHYIPDDMFVRSMVAMHLADYPSGVPMYAVENGFYWHQKGEITNVSRLLRLPFHIVQHMPAVATKQEFATLYVDPQRERWLAEAKALWDMFKALGAVNERGVEQLAKYYNINLPA